MLVRISVRAAINGFPFFDRFFYYGCVNCLSFPMLLVGTHARTAVEPTGADLEHKSAILEPFEVTTSVLEPTCVVLEHSSAGSGTTCAVLEPTGAEF